MDLFEAADENGPKLEEAVLSLRAGPLHAMQAQSDAFLETVKSADVSINMRISGLVGFLSVGELRSWPSNAIDVAETIDAQATDVLQAQLGPWYPKRLSFEETWTAGRSIHYGALNAGGTGVTYFGDYCVVLKSEQLSTTGLAYVRDDSLAYVDDTGAVLSAALQANLATEKTKHLLALLKHVSDVSLPQQEWPKALCSSSSYIEAIFLRGDVLHFLQSIRISASQMSLTRDLVMRTLRQNLSTSEKLFVDDYVTLSVLLKQHHTVLEVPDA